MKTVHAFVYTCTLVSVLAVATSCSTSTITPSVRPAHEAAIQHVIVMMQENRSFNKFVCWLSRRDDCDVGSV